MKVLVASQCGQICEFVLRGQKQVSPSRNIYKDTGEDVKYPISLNEKRERIFIPATYTYTYTFADLCELFSQNVVEMTAEEYNGKTPRWGEGWYIAGDDGFAKLGKENFDTSD